MHFLQVGSVGNRYQRMLFSSRVVYKAALSTGSDLFHFHDSELIPVGLALRARGKRVIYDVHESLAKSILSKPYLPAGIRRPIAMGAQAAEFVMARAATAIIAATPAIARQFPPGKTITIQNFPILGELAAPTRRPYQDRPPVALFSGGITRHRGVIEMVEAIGETSHNARLSLVGSFGRADTEAEARSISGWERVDFHGWQPRSALPDLMGEARVGLVLFHPEPNHVEAMPNKLFEYMSAGLPVIASDFPLWRSIVDDAGCGLLVDPQDPRAIAEAIDWMLEHPEEAEEMGHRGRKAVESRYNWEAESKKLIALYQRLLA